jgi:alkanesulfonate monooxygenase SsuD/methylene tetrahydromethanopterin reductase-like flavin-dependent oxidoreductase (luciferase family)
MPILPDTKFYAWHFMPYTALPANVGEQDSLWVDFPNSHFDPVVGYGLYQRYISELVLADRLGFDGVCVNEHHNTPYSLMPNPSVMAAALIPQVKGNICVMGTPPGLDQPHRLAEAYAMLDVMSGGRLEVAFPLGTPMEYWSSSVNPVTARERQQEALDVILKAWTQDGPISHHGRFYNYRYLNIWPRPFQKPHPRAYLVGSGSPSTIELAARYGFGYSSTFSPIAAQLEAQALLKQRAAHYGHIIAPEQTPITCMVYIGDDDESALAEMEPHVRYFFTVLTKAGRFINAPGYLTMEEFQKRNGQMIHASHGGAFDWLQIRKLFRVVAGTPTTVANAIERWAEDAGTNRIIFQIHRGDMPHWKVVRTLTCLAEEVIPLLKRRQTAAARDHELAAAK